ncbi:MAG: PD40 domain-containing protein [Elusimicrobia bacterium]|nr:PD40 domain-containing protein [Elusimicrobiota bacterium]
MWNVEYRMRYFFSYIQHSAFNILSLIALVASLAFADDAPVVRMGIREILGGSQAAKARLGIVNFPDQTNEANQVLDIVRSDLSLIGLVELYEMNQQEAAGFASPRLELRAVLSKKGVLVSAGILAGKEMLFSRNFQAAVPAGPLAQPGTDELRHAGHRTAAMALKALTGETAFFTSKIAFALRYKNKKEIWLADWDGKNAVPVTQWSSISLLPAFGPDGRELAFSSYRDGNPDLYLYELNGKTTRQISTHQGLNTSAAFDPSGEGFVLTLSLGRDPNLYFISREGKIIRRLTNTYGVDTAPVFSPNGKELAFTTDRSGNPQIFIMNRDGSNARRLTYGFFWADEADWSPDGTAVAFAAKKARDENFQIFLGDPMGIRFVQITSDGSNEHPVFSPDSRFLAYSSNRNGKGEIFIKGLTPETGEIKIISFSGADCLDAAWSAPEKE